MEHPQVVKIFTTTQEPDHDNPWQMRAPSDSTGSGVLVGPRRVLTGAHVVANATFVQIQRFSDPDKQVAHIEAICHDCDLAVLTLERSALEPGIEPAEIGELPRLRDRVTVVGFPVGGEEISITEGVVSRVEVQRYTHSQRRLLAVTVDAAINDGNSGGPAFRDGRIVGIAFQKLQSADNIGELVPAPLIHRFLAGIEQGKSLSVPGLGIRAQNLENPRLRRHLGLEDGESGVLVTRVEHGGSAWGRLESGDAVLSIDGHPVANNGTVRYLDRHRTRFDVVLGQHYVDDVLPVEILREGIRQTVEVTLRPEVWLVPRSRYGVLPTWFVFGGLVFQVLTRDFLTTWSEWWKNAPDPLLNSYNQGLRTPERQEVVLLSKVLADALTVGYGRFAEEVVESVDGVVPRDMRHFVSLVESAGPVLEIRTTSGLIVLDVAEARAENERILARYRIPGDRSEDLV